MKALLLLSALAAGAEAFTPGSHAGGQVGHTTHRFRPLVRPLSATITVISTGSTRVSTRPPLDIQIANPYAGRRRAAPGVAGGAYDTAAITQLLSQEEEVHLARLVQQRQAFEGVRQRLMTELGREPTLSEWAAACTTGGGGGAGGWEAEDAFARALGDGDAAKAALINANVRLVLAMARRHKTQPGVAIPESDLVQEGMLGLVRAVEKYDPERGFRFSTYATLWVKQAFSRAVSDQGRTIRLPVHVHESLRLLRKEFRSLTAELGAPPTNAQLAHRLGLSLEKLQWLYACERNAKPISLSVDAARAATVALGGAGVSVDALAAAARLTVGDAIRCSAPGPEGYVSVAAMQEDVDALLRSLAPRERIVLRMRYGLDNGGRGETYDSIAAHISVTRETVRQTERRALERLRTLSGAVAAAAREHARDHAH